MCDCAQGDSAWLVGLLVAFAVLLIWRLSQRQTAANNGRHVATHVLFLTGALALTTVVPAFFGSGCSAPAKVDRPSKPESLRTSDALKGGEKPAEPAKPDQAKQEARDGSKAALRLPKLLDLGATKCIPCKMMAPILEELKTTYKGKMDVEFIDVWQNQAAAKQYGIESIPTQIFYSAEGKELFRHEGFFSKQDILGKWKELGVDLGVEPQK